MEQQMSSLPREHHFYVATAKFLFHHSEYGIVSVRDPIKIKSAEQYGLKPLILYGLTVAGLPIRWVTLTSFEQPKAFQEVLLEAWCKAEGLRGKPEILRINRHLAKACPELVSDMAKIGVRVEVADAKDKSLPASLRSAQESYKWLFRRAYSHDRSLEGAIKLFCQCVQDDHDFRVRNGNFTANSREVEDRLKAWLTLPAKIPALITFGCLSWKLGSWLSSWEASLAPDQPRYFSFDRLDGNTWLLTGENIPQDIDEDDGFWTDVGYDNTAEIAKHLVACWPNPPVWIAKNIGSTLRELQWFTSGKASLEQHVRVDLKALLGIEFDESMGRYFGAGPYVLMAHKSQAIMAVYETLSSGGIAHLCEIVPRHGAADPSWRYILIDQYEGPPSIVMAPRGSRVTERLPDLFLNYDGIRIVASEFFRDVVSTCAKACQEPAANIREMKSFAKRFDSRWADGAWLQE
ncbi:MULTISPECIES: hypothetical protein [Aeromonas]|uniref:hypothetical protein n=1 Tax=Aeromonas TaxID=642 RepID=UPI001F1484B2|nr:MULTISPECIES: hypothetical protein [Aeromonas]MCJ8218307.1 hypothetical protein [Aeromonas veronii]